MTAKNIYVFIVNIVDLPLHINFNINMTCILNLNELFYTQNWICIGFITWLRHFSGHYNPVIIFCDNARVRSHFIFSLLKKIKWLNHINKIKFALSGIEPRLRGCRFDVCCIRGHSLLYPHMYQYVMTTERDVGHAHAHSRVLVNLTQYCNCDVKIQILRNEILFTAVTEKNVKGLHTCL